MPEKDGAEEKSTKSVVNKKQKQFMNQEDYIPEQEDSSMNVQKKKSTSELRREIEQRNVERVKRRDDKAKSMSVTGQSAVRDSQKYASGEYPKIGGGERPDPKSKGVSASTGGTNTKPVTGGPKENPKSLGGKSKGNTPVKVNIKKKPDLSKYFGEKIDPLNFGKSKRTPEQKQQARAQKQRTDAVFNTKKGLSDMKTGTQSSEFLKTQKDVKKKPEDSQPLDEEGYDIARDMGKVRPSKDKKDATTMPVSKEMRKTQKVNKGPSALERIRKKYKGQIMDELDLTQVAEAFGGYIIEQEQTTNQRTGRKKITKRFVTGDGTIPIGGEKKDRKPTRTKQTSFDQRIQTGDPDFYRKKRAELISKRDEYEIDKKGNITDRGVEKYARQMYRTNEPLTQDQLDKAREAAVGGTEVKDSKGNVVGTTTGKYGGRLAKQKSLLKQLTRKPPKPKVSLQEPEGETKTEPETQTAVGGEPPIPPKRTAVDAGGDRPKKTDAFSSIKKFAKNNPQIAAAGTLAGYDIGKGILSKIMNLRGPGLRGGTVGRRSAGTFTAT